MTMSLVPNIITSNNMQERAGVALARTLGMIKRDPNRLLKYGKGKIASAKRFHNCVRSPLLDIEPSQVVPPYLHILLGVTLRHHNMLEDSAHQLDCMLGKSVAKPDFYPASKFTRDFEDKAREAGRKHKTFRGMHSFWGNGGTGYRGI